MHQAKRGRCRFLDQNLGRTSWSGRNGHLSGSGACKGAPHEESKELMSHFEKFVTEGNEKADELAKGALLYGGLMVEASGNYAAGRVGVYAASQYAASFHCLVERWKDCEELKPKPKEKLIFVDQKREDTKHRTEWCAEADRYRCMRCGRGSKYRKMPGKCTRPEFMSKSLGKWRRRHLRGPDLVRRMGRQ